MRVLVISSEVWRHDTNGGNVLSDIFKDTPFEFAQIFCNEGSPNNELCSKYYKITDSMVVSALISGTEPGVNLTNDESAVEATTSVSATNKILRKVSSYKWQFLYLVKEIIWGLGMRRRENLNAFISDFNPDIVFAPCYGSPFMLSLTRHVARVFSKPIISYISDDHHSYQQFSYSPIFWLNRLILRYCIKKTFPYYALTYTMTDEQLSECSRDLKCDMKLLRKSSTFSGFSEVPAPDQPIRIVYAGSIYAGRAKTLIALCDAIATLNQERHRFTLDIYTSSSVSKRVEKVLNNGSDSFVHKSVPLVELAGIYSRSHVALHVESFEKKYKYITRLSFSTKILDCLSSGCAVMAICWENNSGFKYLRNEKAAMCIDRLDDIAGELENIYSQRETLAKYQRAAKNLCLSKHSALDQKTMILSDFNRLVG